MMYFYTTAEQEADLEAEYKRQLAVKQAEIDEVEARTRKIQKFTAYGHVHKPDRVFDVRDGHVFYRGLEIPTGPVEGGDVYTFDTHFSKQIAEFCKKHSAYKVVFKPHGRYGPCLGYIGSPGSMPAQLIAVTGEVLDADNEDAYDLLCC
jgi:hypothetical protein